MGIIRVINIKGDNDYSCEDGFFYVGRSRTMKSPLGNPFTHNGKRSNLAKLSFKTREEAIAAYEKYFDMMYGSDDDFTKAFDEIYEFYKSGKDVYLGCFCAPLPCHASIIAKKLQQKLVKENIQKMKEKKNG